jgi:DNA topoisomerase-3
METAGKLVDELELREALKDKGLGTPATRASVIETLLDRKYVARENKNLMATDSGRYLVAIVRDRNLKSAELTGEWEAKLKRIEAGQLKPEEFMREIVAFTREVVQLSDAAPVDENRLGDCPRCGRPVIRGKRGLGCSAWREGCDFVLWPTYGQRELDDHQLRALLQHRALGVPIENDEGQHVLLTMVDSGALVEVPVPTSNQQTLGKPSVRAAPKRKRTRKSSEAKASSRTSPGKASIAKSSVRIDAEQGSADLGPCPLCGASIVEQKKSYCCSRWQSGCELTIWKRMSGKRISARTAKTLLRHGETSILKGFKSKSGQPFSARLKLQEGKVTFAFDRD